MATARTVQVQDTRSVSSLSSPPTAHGAASTNSFPPQKFQTRASLPFVSSLAALFQTWIQCCTPFWQDGRGRCNSDMETLRSFLPTPFPNKSSCYRLYFLSCLPPILDYLLPPALPLYRVSADALIAPSPPTYTRTHTTAYPGILM